MRVIVSKFLFLISLNELFVHQCSIFILIVFTGKNLSV